MRGVLRRRSDSLLWAGHICGWRGFRLVHHASDDVPPGGVRQGLEDPVRLMIAELMERCLTLSRRRTRRSSRCQGQQPARTRPLMPRSRNPRSTIRDGVIALDLRSPVDLVDEPLEPRDQVLDPCSSQSSNCSGRTSWGRTRSTSSENRVLVGPIRTLSACPPLMTPGSIWLTMTPA